MAKRDRVTLGISFFSFQDIITSITGIMFLIVIFIVLSIIEKQVKTSPKVNPEVKKTEVDLEVLTKQVEKLRKTVQERKTWLADHAKQLEELSKLDFNEIERRCQEAEKIRKTVESTLIQTRGENEAKKLVLSKIEKTSEETDVKYKIAVSKSDKKEKELSELRSTLSELKEKESKKRTISVTHRLSEQKEPVLVECGKDGIQAKIYSRDVPVDFRTPESIHQMASVSKFMNWVGKLDPNRYYFVIFVTPESWSYAEKLSQKLKDAGIERGMEILPDGEHIF